MATTQATLDGLEEPWKDADTLRHLYRDRTQAEMAEYFSQHGHDVTPATISYWMNKLGVSTIRTDHSEDDPVEKRECVNFEECGNETPSPGNLQCDDCLDEARENGRGHDCGDDSDVRYY